MSTLTVVAVLGIILLPKYKSRLFVDRGDVVEEREVDWFGSTPPLPLTLSKRLE